MLIRRSLVCSFLACLSTSVYADPPKAEIQAFLEKATLVVDALNAEVINSGLVDQTISEMLELAKPVLPAYAAKHTQCTEQLAKLIELYPELNKWTAQEIRRNIEGGQSLPPAEGCYPARDIVAHPAIVRTFARTGIDATLRPRMVREMNEAIEHMQEIALELEQK